MFTLILAITFASSPATGGDTLLSKELIDQVKSDEGFSRKSYQCSEDHCTIGYGYNLDANPLGLTATNIEVLKRDGITEAGASKLLVAVLENCQADLFKAVPWVADLSQRRQDALVNMTYQMGIAGVLKFKNSLKLIKAGKFGQAAEALLLSKWAKQTPNRALRISNMIRQG
jgi:lysozyme